MFDFLRITNDFFIKTCYSQRNVAYNTQDLPPSNVNEEFLDLKFSAKFSKRIENELSKLKYETFYLKYKSLAEPIFEDTIEDYIKYYGQHSHFHLPFDKDMVKDYFNQAFMKCSGLKCCINPNIKLNLEPFSKIIVQLIENYMRNKKKAIQILELYQCNEYFKAEKTTINKYFEYQYNNIKTFKIDTNHLRYHFIKFLYVRMEERLLKRHTKRIKYNIFTDLEEFFDHEKYLESLNLIIKKEQEKYENEMNTESVEIKEADQRKCNAESPELFYKKTKETYIEYVHKKKKINLKMLFRRH